MTKQKWTKFGGLSLGVALASILLLFVFSTVEGLNTVLVWGIVLGLIGLMVGVVGRGFAKS